MRRSCRDTVKTAPEASRHERSSDPQGHISEPGLLGHGVVTDKQYNGPQPGALTGYRRSPRPSGKRFESVPTACRVFLRSSHPSQYDADREQAHRQSTVSFAATSVSNALRTVARSATQSKPSARRPAIPTVASVSQAETTVGAVFPAAADPVEAIRDPRRRAPTGSVR